MAARLYRTVPADERVKEFLRQSQFLEVTALVTMAEEMGTADLEARQDAYSDMAQLPAPHCVLEFVKDGVRIALLCNQTQTGGNIEYLCVVPGKTEPAPIFRGGFTPGTPGTLGGEWIDYDGSERGHRSAYTGAHADILEASDERFSLIMRMNISLEKFLCIINQPGLVDRRERDADKRVVREALKSGQSVPDKWHVCVIRPGQHTKAGETKNPGEPVMPLHYVRKYFKPSLGKWVDGFWRGDIALGLHLKWYSPQPPQGGAA
jgi:hypothetical protein